MALRATAESLSWINQLPEHPRMPRPRRRNAMPSKPYLQRTPFGPHAGELEGEIRDLDCMSGVATSLMEQLFNNAVPKTRNITSSPKSRQGKICSLLIRWRG